MTIHASPYVVQAAERAGILTPQLPKPRWLIELRQGDRIIGEIQQREVYDSTWEEWNDVWSWIWFAPTGHRFGADAASLLEAQREIEKAETEQRTVAKRMAAE